MKIEINDNVERVAAYIRVSTQEQKLHGISLDAQRDKLTEYSQKNKLKIVEWYEDEGISGRKLIKNRPELQRMLNDAQARKFDRIIFIKLDRFFRSVAEYHECMKLIDPVLWTATEEKYDLTTANGRAFVNMKLTIAELEADQTGERISLVNEYKIRTGQALTGAHCQGFAYTVQKDSNGVKRVVKDPETAPIVYDFINHFLTHQSKRMAHLYIKNKYHIDVSYNSLTKVLMDPKLCGSYKGNDNYVADPYVDMETFVKLQEILKSNVKVTAARKIFLFSGLLTCPRCGKKMTGKFDGGTKRQTKSGKTYSYYREYYHYRCNHAHKDQKCLFKKNINENIIENYLIENFDQYVNSYITEVSITDNSAEQDSVLINKKISSIKTEMAKVKRMYRKGDMSESEYDSDMDELKDELKELESLLEPIKERDLTVYNDLINSGWITIYKNLTRENKRAFWHKYIKTIKFNGDGTINDIIFF